MVSGLRAEWFIVGISSRLEVVGSQSASTTRLSHVILRRSPKVPLGVAMYNKDRGAVLSIV